MRFGVGMNTNHFGEVGLQFSVTGKNKTNCAKTLRKLKHQVGLNN